MEGAGALAEISSGVVADVLVKFFFYPIQLLGVLSVVAIVLSACPLDERDEYEERSGHDGGGDFGVHGSGRHSSAVLPSAIHARYAA